MRGRLRTAWVQGGSWKWVGEKKPLKKWVRRTVRTAADGAGATEWLEMGGEKKPLVISELGCTANGWGELRGRLRTAWVPGKPLEISELGCADGCGREMGAENCADGCGRPGCKRVAGHG